MKIISIIKDNIKYHALQISSHLIEDIEIFTSAKVVKSKNDSCDYLINRELLVSIDDWLIKDKRGILNVIKDINMYYPAIIFTYEN